MKSSRLSLSDLCRIQSILIGETSTWSDEGKKVLYTCGLYVTRESIIRGPASDGEIRIFNNIESILKSGENRGIILRAIKISPSIFCSIEVLGKLLVGIANVDTDGNANLYIGSSFDPMPLVVLKGYSLSSYVPVTVKYYSQLGIHGVSVSNELSHILSSDPVSGILGDIPITVVSIREEDEEPIGRYIVCSCEKFDPNDYSLKNVVNKKVVDTLLTAVCKEIDLPLKMINFIYNGSKILNKAICWQCPDGEYVVSYYYKP